MCGMRAVPIAEAMLALVIMDYYLQNQAIIKREYDE